jgi:general stress protein 26
MSQDATVASVLDAARQTITAAGCASMITVDETGLPSSRAVAAFEPDDSFSRIAIASHPASRKTVHVQNDPRVVLSYIDLTNRGYLTVIGTAHFDDRVEEKKKCWTDSFSAFFPGGPESEEYMLVILVPERLELRAPRKMP